jgi:hypothetical protein
MASWTCSSAIARGAPGRGSSLSSSSQASGKRDCHLRMVSRDTPSLTAVDATRRLVRAPQHDPRPLRLAPGGLGLLARDPAGLGYARRTPCAGGAGPV